MDKTDYNQLKFVLNFFIKAKDECTDAFVLFDEMSAAYILDLADRFQAHAWSSEAPEAQRLRVFDFVLTRESALFHQMIARLRQLAATECYHRKFRGYVIAEVEHRALTAYFAPFQPDDQAMTEAVAALRATAQS